MGSRAQLVCEERGKRIEFAMRETTGIRYARWDANNRPGSRGFVNGHAYGPRKGHIEEGRKITTQEEVEVTVQPHAWAASVMQARMVAFDTESCAQLD
jgi:hypothetical protein